MTWQIDISGEIFNSPLVQSIRRSNAYTEQIIAWEESIFNQKGDYE